ncbi:unnamed protein product [Vitrella brassicaformis CCMP3155]|uniref:Uncharacterized protein n=1 Tax=Vitrella brassicaformis (strain CCMP3155) TaxID=1169540 RepID=A0A0G4FIG8_VITBC|nr:unnamed protein product [Vitrella brassicaformis CCMP3155]|eukprot:CEM13241.1 unnamed protein product [Vitrella brassicaformis CCMP3155]
MDVEKEEIFFDVALSEPDKGSHGDVAMFGDADGDLDLPRPFRGAHAARFSVLSAPRAAEPSSVDLSTVSVSLWRAALRLGDLLLAVPYISSDTAMLELGCGVGFLGSLIVAAGCQRSPRRLFLTDCCLDSLRVAHTNVTRAAGEMQRHIDFPAMRYFDWCALADAAPCRWREGLLAGKQGHESVPAEFCWTDDELDVLGGGLDLIVASDVLYDFDGTDALARVLLTLATLNPSATIIIAHDMRLTYAGPADECPTDVFAAHFLDTYVDASADIERATAAAAGDSGGSCWPPARPWFAMERLPPPPARIRMVGRGGLLCDGDGADSVEFWRLASLMKPPA